MELELLTQTVHTAQTVLETAAENPFDLDIRLPEYYPDIQRVLQCTVAPNLQTVALSADRINAEGTGILRMLYASENKEVVSFEQTFPISQSVRLPDAPQDPVVTAYANTDFVNCRASGQRRAAVHGVVSVRFRVQTAEPHIVITGSESSAMQLRRTPVELLELSACAAQTFAMSEVVEIPRDVPPVGHILRAHATLRIESTKAVQDKLLIKGDARTEILYSTDADGDTFRTFRHTMPLSQIIEAQGITDKNLQDVTLDVRSLEVNPKADGSGEMRLLEIALRIGAVLYSQSTISLDAVCDAYSTDTGLQTQYKAFPFRTCVGQLAETVSEKQTPELSAAGITKLLDCSCTSLRPTFRAEAGCAVVDCTAVLQILYRDADGNPAITEKEITFTCRKPLNTSAEKLCCTPIVQCTGCTGTLTANGQVEILPELLIYGVVYAEQEIRLLVACEAGESEAAQDRAALTIYFADKDEAVWDIAQKYRTTVESVLAENHLSEETIAEKCLLMIPSV